LECVADVLGSGLDWRPRGGAPAALQRAALLAAAPPIDHPAVLSGNRWDCLTARGRATVAAAASITEETALEHAV